ncbi:MAG: twin-arginine translocase subunit TatC, partial [Spirochaetia bacterium]|nr:twin-arginine translocase subunit TatC [Spirochaetia bacterium]
MSEKRKPKTKIIPTARISQRPVNQQPDFNLDDEIQQEEGTGARDRLMTIGHHLEELRRRILWSIGILVFTASIIGFFINDVHAFLTLPYHQLTGLKLYLGSVYASAEILFSLSILLAIVITLPIILFILWGFFTPAVSPRTARMGNVAMGASTLLFWAG